MYSNLHTLSAGAVAGNLLLTMWSHIFVVSIDLSGSNSNSLSAVPITRFPCSPWAWQSWIINNKDVKMNIYRKPGALYLRCGLGSINSDSSQFKDSTQRWRIVTLTWLATGHFYSLNLASTFYIMVLLRQSMLQWCHCLVWCQMHLIWVYCLLSSE